MRTASAFARFSNNVLSKLQVKQRPNVSISAKNNVTTSSAVSSIRTSTWDEFFSVHVSRASTACSRTTTDFYVIDEI
jgi:hypothetical protein